MSGTLKSTLTLSLGQQPAACRALEHAAMDALPQQPVKIEPLSNVRP